MYRSYQEWRQTELFKEGKEELLVHKIILDHIVNSSIGKAQESQDVEAVVKAEYNDLCDTVWNSLIPTLPEDLREYKEDTHKLLCGIMMVLFQNIEVHYTKVKTILCSRNSTHRSVSDLVTSSSSSNNQTDKETVQDSEGTVVKVPEAVQLRFLSTVDTVPLEHFTNIHTNMRQLYEQKYITSDDVKRLVQNDALAKFLERTGRLCWRLVCAQPHFTLSRKHQMHNWEESYTEFVDLLEGSDADSPSGLIQYYGKPVLLRGQTVISKGLAYISAPGN